MYSLEQFEEKIQKSATAQKLGIKNEIPEQFGDRIFELYRCYQAISQYFALGISDHIYITSGYRCSELNKVVGGVPGSKHCQCKAFDFGFSNVVGKSDFNKSFEALKNNVVKYYMRSGLSFDEAVTNFRKHFIAYPNNLFVHFQRS